MRFSLPDHKQKLLPRPTGVRQAANLHPQFKPFRLRCYSINPDPSLTTTDRFPSSPQQTGAVRSEEKTRNMLLPDSGLLDGGDDEVSRSGCFCFIIMPMLRTMCQAACTGMKFLALLPTPSDGPSGPCPGELFGSPP